MEDIDDFENDKEIQEIRKAEAAYKKMVEESVEIINQRFQIEEQESPNIDQFWMIRQLQKTEVMKFYRSTHPLYPIQVFIIEYISTVKSGRIHSSGEDDYLFGLITTKKKYQDTLIYPEKLSEKLADIFTRAEVDFKEHKKFSKSFYVLAKDKEQLRNSFLTHTLDDLASHKTMEIELLGNQCLFRTSRRPIEQEEAKDFCVIAEKLIRIFA